MKNILRNIALAGVLGTSALGMSAQMPDSLYVFSYAEDGRTGLRMAVSPDGQTWSPVGPGADLVKSDFGSWGSAPSSKKMYGPQLYHSPAKGRWYCIWAVTPDGETFACAESPDLVNWRPQTFFRKSDLGKFIPSDARSVRTADVTLGGTTFKGLIQMADRATVKNLLNAMELRAARTTLNNEQARDDASRFASLGPLKANLDISADSKPISNTLIGIFFEDINYAADGGLYAELVRNRDFEFSSTDRREWTPLTGWEWSGGEVTVATSDPIHPNNPNYAVATPAPGETLRLANSGFDGIPVKKGEKYDSSLRGRTSGGSTHVKASLVSPDGSTLGSTTLKIGSRGWKECKGVITANAAADSATLVLELTGKPTTHLDMVSLFPRATFKGRRNGLRADLAQTLADLQPRFVRFPGGCVAHGNGVDNIYDWKGSIGPLEARKPLRNLWGYHQTRGLGYHEYFLFCEDINAEPLPVLAAGVPCQNSSIAAHHTHDDLTLYGQQDGIPMEEMDTYIQDVLDLIEYANGDARTSEWGRLRAQAGHPEPFNLKYIGIGNEDLISEAFKVRFKMINDAVKSRYPDIQVVGTAGPFYEGADYDEGWALARAEGVDMVDEHYYVQPGWMINNQDFYDNYDRKGPKVYLGEYAAHVPGRLNNMETALAEALYLTSVERNADVVAMTSYAPLLAKDGRTQWRPDLIYFSNNDVRPTTDYYVQQMYGNNSGDRYVDSRLDINTRDEAARRRVGVSTVTDSATGDMIVKLVNMLPMEVSTTLNLPEIYGSATRTVLSGKPENADTKPVTDRIDIASATTTVNLPAYSFVLLRMHR